MNSSPNCNWARCVSIMRAPELLSFSAQSALIDLADLFQDAADAIEVSDLPANLRNLVGMEGGLTCFASGIIHIQDPLTVALTAGAGRARNRAGVERVAFQ